MTGSRLGLTRLGAPKNVADDDQNCRLLIYLLPNVSNLKILVNIRV